MSARTSSDEPGTAAAAPGFDLPETARRVGHYAWTESRLFQVFGAWSLSVPEPEAKTLLARHCTHHAWHADLWRDRLPDLQEMPPDSLTVPTDPAIERFFDAMVEPDGPESTIEKLIGAYRVLIPRLITAYTLHLDRTSELTDAPTHRALTLVLRDQHDDLHDGELLLQSLTSTSDPERAERATAHQRRLESLLVGAHDAAAGSSEPR